MSDDLDSLIYDLGTFPRHAGRFVKTALNGTALEAKQSWQELAKRPSGTHARAYPFSVDYDVRGEFPSFEAEVGPNLGRAQGALGILEDAPGGVTSSPQNVRPRVVKAVEKDFERGQAAAVDDALKRAGL